MFETATNQLTNSTVNWDEPDGKTRTARETTTTWYLYDLRAVGKLTQEMVVSVCRSFDGHVQRVPQ